MMDEMRSCVLGLVCACACACGRLDFDPTPAVSGDGPAGDLQLVYPVDHAIAVLGVTPISLVPTLTGSAALSIAPALPAGVNLDPTTGQITGIPTAMADADFVVTATAGAATAKATVHIQALAGYVVDSTADASDADGGTDTVCADSAGGCTLRAAIETANAHGMPALVLLGPATYLVSTQLPALATDIEIAGQGAGVTMIQAATLHGNYPAITCAGSHTLALRDLGMDDFGGSDGGALAITAGTLDVDRCSFTNNASPTSGGVLFINGGSRATFDHCTFTQNASLGGNGGGWGGVIDGEGTGTQIVVRRSTATQNTTAWGSFSHITSGTTLLLESSTLYNNTSNTAGTLATPGGVYTLVNDTIVGNHNTTTDSAGIYLYSAPCHYTITNTIVAHNDNTAGSADCNIRDLSTNITSGGGNILDDAGGNCGQYFTGPGDHLSTDPAVVAGAPAANGGRTATILLGSGSPALGDGQASACPATDQRDLPRKSPCDAGAVEMTGN